MFLNLQIVIKLEFQARICTHKSKEYNGLFRVFFSSITCILSVFSHY